MGTRIVRARTAERPDIAIWWTDRTGALIDYSSGYTFTFKVGSRGAAALFTKTTGITGAAGSGTDPTGTPNITITFTAGELATAMATAPARTYRWELIATTAGSLDRYADGDFVLTDVIT